MKKQLQPDFKSGPLNFEKCKISFKQKCFEFETKFAFFRYFCAAFLKNLLSYWKSTPSNLRGIAKIHVKKLWDLNQEYLVWVLSGQNLKKNSGHIWNQHLQIFQNANFHLKLKKIDHNCLIWVFLDWNLIKLLYAQEWILTIIVNSDIVPSSSDAPGFAFWKRSDSSSPFAL